MAPKNSFLMIFSLQAGACITTTVGSTVMIIVFFYNVGAKGCDRCMAQNLQHGLLFIYIAIMTCGFVVASTGSYKARPELMQSGISIIISGFVLWLILSLVGFVPFFGMYKYVCIDNRCPETHWLYNTRWRFYGDICDPQYLPGGSQNETISTNATDSTKKTGSPYIKCQVFDPVYMVLSGLLFALYCCFIVYGIIKLMAHRKDISYVIY